MGTELDERFETAEKWGPEGRVLRQILLDTGLDEQRKWGKPCYSCEHGNIAIIQRMNDFLALMFFKGALLDDPDGLLHEQGKHTRSALRMQFTSTDEVTDQADAIASFVAQAIEVEQQGLSVEPAPAPELPDELLARFESEPALEEAFRGLTPGRQRAYAMHIGDAAREATRERRIDKWAPHILAGKGMNDR